jgi:hypothetical protein
VSGPAVPAQYRNAVRDLLGLDVNVASLLSPGDVSYGFDNVAGVPKTSPTLMEQYLAAAQRVSRLAIGTPPRAPVVDYYRRRGEGRGRPLEGAASQVA